MRGPIIALVLISSIVTAVTVSLAQDAAKAEAELKQLQAEIDRIRNQVARDAAESDRLARSLRTAEKAAAGARAELERLRAERLDRDKRREQLAGERRERESDLARERRQLTAQMRAAYLIGREEPLKLFLNQQDPSKAGRMLAYYGYFGRARAEQLAAIEDNVRQIAQLDAGLATEQERIAQLESRQSTEVSRLDQARNERGQVLTALTTESKARAASLERMQREKAALETLLRELRRASSRFPTDSKSPFALMRGKLAWPASGKLVARFGQKRAGAVKWDGVMISAPRGTSVRAVYRGRVVYADWLAGLGLLLIIDHGSGYLSLYGHNEQLYRAVGDQVGPGDTVASVGDSGGRAAPELYFEIRQAARPIDPVPWFKDRQP
jgi:septal ring factor EnvC (AmiA/AmiB activator)